MIEFVMAAALPLMVPHSPFAGEEPKGDPEKLNEIVGGVDFRSENDFRVPVYNEKGNLLMNPSFESGMRYYRTDRLWREFLTAEDAHSGLFSARLPARYNGVFPPVGYKVIGVVLKPDTWYTVSCFVKSATGEPLSGIRELGSWSVTGTSGWSSMLPQTFFRPIDGDWTPDAQGWVRVAGSFCTASNNNGKVAAPIHETVINGAFAQDVLYDDFQLEEGRVATPYRGPSVGLDIRTRNPEPYLVNDIEKGPVSLAVSGGRGTKVRLEISHRDIMERSVMPKKEAEISFDSNGVVEIPLGDRADFPKGVNGFAVRVTEADGHVYEDYLRLNRFHFANGTAKNRPLQTVPDQGWLRRQYHDVSDFRQLMFLGIGGLSYSGNSMDTNRNTRADIEYMRRYGIEDYWGNGGVWYCPYGELPGDALPQGWKGVHISQMESYPDEYLKVLENAMYVQAKAYPHTLFWSMHTEPQGGYKTLMAGKLEEYAKMIHAIYTGMKRANPSAVLQPYGAYNMEQLGRGWVSAMMATLKRMYPNDDYPVIDIHSYRAFPEHPSLEEDFVAFLDCLERAGYPNIKVKVGEGSYYYPMMRRSINMLPWTGVAEHDGYFWVVVPGYDLGAGEKIGAALNIRESLVYYKYRSRVHSTCSWNPRFIDSRTPCAWMIANASLIELLGDASFVEDVRFSTEGRCYVFDDGHGSTVAAIWNANERFDRGLDEATTLRMANVDGLEIYDLYGNKVKVKGEGEQRMEIPFSGYVVYLKVKNEGRESLLKALRAATVDSDADRLPLMCGITLKSGTDADVRIENPFSREQTFAVKIGDADEERLALKPRDGVALKAKLTENLKPGTFATVKLPIRFTVEGRTFDKDYTADALVVPYVAGDKPDWAKIPAAKLPYRHSMNNLNEKPHEPTGPNDCSLVTAALGWNENHLFMKFVAHDDKFAPVGFEQYGPTHTWQLYGHDGLQLFFDSFGNAVEKSRRGVIGHDFDDFSYEICTDVATSNAAPHGVCFRRFAPDHQLTFGVSEHKFHHNVIVPEIPVKLDAKDGLVQYEVDFPAFYLKPLKLEAGGVSPGLGIEYYDRDDVGVYPKLKYSNDSFREACGHPHTYPQLIFVKDGPGASEDDIKALREKVGIAKAFADGVRTNEIVGACSVLYDDGLVLEDYAGWADPVANVPMGPDVEFAIYSQTKGICGALFTTLMDEGKVKLDDPVSKWLPEFADLNVMNNPTNLAAGTHKLPMPITLRHLLTHTSGHGGNGPEKWRRPNMTLREVARTVAAEPWPCDPELMYKYSNTGIDIAAAAIEVIAGEPFEILLQKRIFDPCGMKDTTFFPTSNQFARTAQMMWRDEKGAVGGYFRDKSPYNGTAAAAGQGLYSTTADMLRFTKMLMNKGRVGDRQVLSEYAVTNILSRSQTPASVEQPYSLGLVIEGDWFGHGGALQTDYRVDWKHRRIKVFMIRQGAPWKPPAKQAWYAGSDIFFNDADSHKYDRFRGPTGD